MLIFNFFVCRLQKICVHVEYQNSKFDFLKKNSFVFVGPGWNKNLYSAGA